VRLSRLSLALLALPLLACGRLLDAEEFRVTSASNPCGSNQVLRNGKCQAVGVAVCGKNFDPSEGGGCQPKQPTKSCAEGLYAPPGARQCSAVGALTCMNRDFPVADTMGDVRYVAPAADADGDGSRQHPFRTLREATQRITMPVTLLLATGTYPEGLDLSEAQAPVWVFGDCGQNTAIEGAAGAPAIVVGPGASGSKLQNFAISRGSTGIEASGVDGLELEGIWIHDIDGPGLRLDDTLGSSRATVRNLLIERVADAGVAAYGTDLELESAVISHVTPDREGARAVGIEIGASAVFTGGDPGVRTAGRLTLADSAIGFTTGAGVLGQESTVTVTGTWIHDVDSDGLGQSRAIDVRASPTQTLDTSLDVSGSVLEDSHELGILSLGARATLSNVTVRNIGAGADDACRGVGVLAAFPFEAAFAQPDGAQLTLRSSSFQGVGRSAVELAGGHGELEGVSLSQPPGSDCAQAVGLRGDVSAVDAAPTLRVEGSRFEGFDSGILLHAAHLQSVDNLLSCNRRSLVGDGAFEGSGACGCGEDWLSCRLEREPVDRPCVVAGDTTCLRLCLDELTTTKPIANATVWVFDHPTVPSALTNQKGCLELSGVPRNKPFLVAASVADYGPGMAMVAPFDEPFEAPSRATLIPLAQIFVFMASTSDDPTGENPTDTRKAPFVDFRVCAEAPTEPPIAGDVCKPLAGASVTLEPFRPRPYYFGSQNFPDMRLTGIEQADVAFARVEPGPQHLILSPPEGSSMRCKPNRWGWPGSAPNELVVHTEPSFTELAAQVVCTLE
jgi:hypothetical protein